LSLGKKMYYVITSEFIVYYSDDLKKYMRKLRKCVIGSHENDSQEVVCKLWKVYTPFIQTLTDLQLLRINDMGIGQLQRLDYAELLKEVEVK